MTSPLFSSAIFAGVLFFCTPSSAVTVHNPTPMPAQQGQDAFAKLPLAFERNVGQTHRSVQYLAQGPGYQVFLGTDDILLRVQKELIDKNATGGAPSSASAALRLQFVGANRQSKIVAGQKSTMKTNYFIGDDPSRYLIDIANYETVSYKGLYRGVDLVLYGNQGQLEYDLVVAPRVPAEKISFRLPGANMLRVSPQGDLLAATALGDVIFRKPVAYQDIGGERVLVAANYILNKDRSVRFQLGQYDADKTLVIDPIVSYSSLLWGTARAVATDASGNTYIAGSTHTKDLPLVSGYQTAVAGAVDAYVVKLDPTGTKALYATYLGARRATTMAERIAIDSAGNAYISGRTDSSAFPVTTGAHRTTAASHFITKLNAAGSALVYSTYFAASAINSIAVDGTGGAYLVGGGAITPTAGAFNPTNNGGTPAFIVKLNPAGSALSYATYLWGGGSDVARGLAVDSLGNAYVTGTAQSSDFPTRNGFQSARSGPTDAFALKMNPTGTGLVYSTLLGGSQDESGYGIAINSSGEAYVVGQTESDNFPVTSGVFQSRKGYPGTTVTNGFITKLSADGSALSYSSFLGGSSCSYCYSTEYDNDKATAVAVDGAGYAYIGGRAKSPAFPSVDSIQNTARGRGDGSEAWPFLAKVTPSGDALVYSTLIGDPDLYERTILGLAVDPMGNVHALGDLDYADVITYPITAGAWLATTSSGRNGRFLLKLGVPKYTTVLASSANPVAGNQPITLTATLQGAKGSGGTVTFTNGNVSLGTAQPTGNTATLTVTLPPGVHRITAVHSGDGKVSLPIFQVVNVQVNN